MRELQTPLRLVSGEETHYGLGWALETVTLAGAGTRVAGHRGLVLGGPAATLALYGERGPVVAVTSNMPDTDTRAVATRLAQAFAEDAYTSGTR